MPQNRTIPRVCLNCGIAFLARPNEVAKGRAVFCSRACSDVGRVRTPEERFWEKVDRSGGPDACWLWTASQQGGGYGQFWTGSQLQVAHKYSYELVHGPVPDGMEVDHVWARGCTNRHCVNPAHLEAVPQQINNLRSNSLSAQNARKTHCKHGHEFTPENTYVRPGVRGGRDCMTCRREIELRRLPRRKPQKLAA